MLLLDKNLLKGAKGLWGWIFAIVAVRFVTLVGITSFSTTMGNYLGSMIDPQVSAAGLQSAVWSAVRSTILIFISQMIQGELEYRCTAKAREDMRTTIFSKVLELDAGSIEKIGPVSAITSSVDAVESMQVYYSVYLPSLIFSVIAPVYLFFRLKNYSLGAAAVLLVVSMSLLPLNNVFRYHIEKLRKVYWRSLDDMTGYYLDSIRGLTTLKLFDLDEEHSVVLGEKAETLNQNINAFMKVNFTSFLVTEGLIHVSLIAAVGIGISSLLKGKMDMGETLTLLMLGYSYFSSIRTLMSATHNAMTAAAAADKVETIMEVDTARAYEPNAQKDPQNFNGIRMEHISFAYPGRNTSLKDVTLEIPRGKTVALAGLSGCGKSTTVSLLMRFFDPEQGKIYMDGNDYLSMHTEELRKKIVMVPQAVTVFSGTIRDNLKLADPGAGDEEMMEALDDAQLGEFVRSLPKGLDSETGENGSMLSGGQKQKIGIARALLSHAEYMIFDEATSAVDPVSEKEIQKTIRHLSSKRTLILISHRLSAIKDADIIYVLDKGEIVEEGNHTHLMENNGLYSHLVERQEKLEKEAPAV